MAKKKKCFECHDTGKCDCVTCGYDGRGPDNSVVRKAGACVVCKARAFRKRNEAALAPYDPRDRNNWEHHAAADGNKGYNVYIPVRGLK